MEQFKAMFGGNGSSSEPNESVLAEWNKYESSSVAPTQSDRLMGQMEAGGATLQNAFSTSIAAAREGAGGIFGSASAGIGGATSFMPSATQFTYFAAFMGGGLLALTMALFVFLPVIIIAPAKFASAFTLGSVLIMGSFFALKGFKAQLSHMLDKDRLLFSMGYVGSMGATLYAALVMHSYVMSLVCCAAQVVALLYYALSYFPGGSAGVRFVLNMMAGACWQCLLSVQKMVSR